MTVNLLTVLTYTEEHEEFTIHASMVSRATFLGNGIPKTVSANLRSCISVIARSSSIFTVSLSDSLGAIVLGRRPGTGGSPSGPGAHAVELTEGC